MPANPAPCSGRCTNSSKLTNERSRNVTATSLTARSGAQNMSGEHPKLIGEGEATLLNFRTPFPIKAMGRMHQGEDGGDGQMSSGFAQTVIDIILKHAPDLDSKLVEMRPSKNGNFLSVTATVNATSKKQLDDIYRELSAHPLVLMAL